MRYEVARAALHALACLAGSAAAGLGQQPDSSSGPEIYAEARVVSRYIWRGYDLSRARPAFQPYVEVTLPNGLGFNAFTTSALDRSTELDEAQLGLTFGREVGGGWEIGAGYLGYVTPGTETEPGSDLADPLKATTSGEFFALVTRSWESAYLTLTYSRGRGAGAGNSVNLWVQRTFTWGAERWSSEPYIQIDYLDEYGAPGGLGERMSGVEMGVPVSRRLRSVRLQAAGYITIVPSSYVRASNVSSGSSSREVLPSASVAVVYERD